MILHVEHNGELTTVGVHKYRVTADKKVVEFDPVSEELTVYSGCDRLKLNQYLFSLVTPFNYSVVIELLPGLCIDYDIPYNIQRSSDWLLRGEADFRIANVKIIVNDEDLRITVLIPEEAKVAIEQRDDDE